MPTAASSTSSSAIQTLPEDPVELVVKDVDGKLHKMVASKTEADKFVNDTILMLDEERARIKQAAHADLDRSFASPFRTATGYRVLCRLVLRVEALLRRVEGIDHLRHHPLLRGRQIQSMTEAVEADVNDYFLRNYKEQVLKPELRDETITQGVEQAVRHAHDSYRRVIANNDMRLQLFLAKHTSHIRTSRRRRR